MIVALKIIDSTLDDGIPYEYLVVQTSTKDEFLVLNPVQWINFTCMIGVNTFAL